MYLFIFYFYCLRQQGLILASGSLPSGCCGSL